MKNILFLLLTIPFLLSSQETITISGDVKDFETGESLIGATIFIPKLKLGTSTNTYGWFSITIPKGEYNTERQLQRTQKHKKPITQGTQKHIFS